MEPALALPAQEAGGSSVSLDQLLGGRQALRGQVRRAGTYTLHAASKAGASSELTAGHGRQAEAGAAGWLGRDRALVWLWALAWPGPHPVSLASSYCCFLLCSLFSYPP